MKTGYLAVIAVTAAMLALGGTAFAAKEKMEDAPVAGSPMGGKSVLMKLGAVADDHIVAQERKFWVTPQTEVLNEDGRKIRLSSLKVRSMLQIDFYWGPKRKLLAARITVVTPPQ